MQWCGDHAHSYTKHPQRSEIAFEGDHEGHDHMDASHWH